MLSLVAHKVLYTFNQIGPMPIRTLCFEPGSPWENGYCESFKSKLRDEFLNGTHLVIDPCISLGMEECIHQPHEYDHTFAELAAAQLVEQLKHKKTSELEIAIKDSTGEWLVRAKLAKKF
jgi:hypothetical protein